MMVLKINWKVFVFSIIVGICIGISTGFIIEQHKNVSIPGNKYYGFPLVWRISGIETGIRLHYFELAVDCIFWTIIFLAVLLFIKVVKIKVE